MDFVRDGKQRDPQVNVSLRELECLAERAASHGRIAKNAVGGRDQAFSHENFKRRLPRQRQHVEHQLAEHGKAERERRIVQLGFGQPAEFQPVPNIGPPMLRICSAICRM